MWSCWINGPDARIVIGTACCEMTDVWREKNSGHTRVMSLEGRYRYQRGDVPVLEHAPDVNVALEEKNVG